MGLLRNQKRHLRPAPGRQTCQQPPDRTPTSPPWVLPMCHNAGPLALGKRHADHLLAALQTDWTGTKFAGIDITWDYIKCTCRLAMDGYILDVLTKYGHPAPSKPQHLAHQYQEIVYSAKTQLIPLKLTRVCL